MGTEITRRHKITYLKEMIEKFFKERPKETISKKRLLGDFGLTLASSERTGTEILKQFEQIGFIKIEGDIITKGKA